MDIIIRIAAVLALTGLSRVSSLAPGAAEPVSAADRALHECDWLARSEIDTWLALPGREEPIGAPAPKEIQPDQPVEKARRPKRKTKRMPPAQPAQIGTAPVPNSPRPKDLGISKIKSSRPGRRAAVKRKPERSAVAG